LPVSVTVYTYVNENHQIPLNERHWSMYALPSPGDRYWHGEEPLRVRSVDANAEPKQLHVDHDHDWAAEVIAALPEGYRMHGGRDADDGRWHFMAIAPPNDRPLGPVFADDLEQALAQAIVNAHQYHQASQGGGSR
jgi:hypothetical protein